MSDILNKTTPRLTGSLFKKRKREKVPLQDKTSCSVLLVLNIAHRMTKKGIKSFAKKYSIFRTKQNCKQTVNRTINGTVKSMIIPERRRTDAKTIQTGEAYQ